MKDGFLPISLEEYLDRHMRLNPGGTRENVKAAIEKMIRFHKDGGRCDCGREIWVIGSGLAQWPACFSHITGEAHPDDDFEIEF